jgi:hypothetical protein
MNITRQALVEGLALVDLSEVIWQNASQNHPTRVDRVPTFVDVTGEVALLVVVGRLDPSRPY